MASGAVSGEEFNALSSNFLNWLRSNNATISPKIQLADLRSQQAGRGVVAVANIEEDEELFSIPRSSILTVETSSLPLHLIQNGPLENDAWLSLILAMIYELYNEPNQQQQRDQQQEQQDPTTTPANSIWKPYLDILPSDFDTLMYWTPRELEALLGSAVVDKIGKASADTAFTEHILPVIRSHAEHFNAAATLSDEELLALCHRMGSTIMAYAFDLEASGTGGQSQTKGTSHQEDFRADEAGEEEAANREWEVDSDEDEEGGGRNLQKGLIPLADMLNADGPERNNAKLFYEASAVTMRALRPIGKGEELLNDYGPLPRADLLRRYGYVSEQYAEFDVVEVTLETIREVALNCGIGDSFHSKGAKEGIDATKRKQQSDERIAYLEEAGLVEDGFDISLPPPPISSSDSNTSENSPHSNKHEAFPDELKSLVNCLTMSDEAFTKLQRKDKAPKPYPLAPEACELLYAIIVKRGGMYPATSASIAGANPGIDDVTGSKSFYRRRMAERVIEGEKRVLDAAAAAVTMLMDARDESGSNGKKRKADDFDADVAEARELTKSHKEARR